MSSTLYPYSASTFRKTFDGILNCLGVPKSLGISPAGLRAGGTVSAYLNDVPIQDLMWRLRLRRLTTLQHYLQEVAAATILHTLSDAAKHCILDASSQFRGLLVLLRSASQAEHTAWLKH